MEKRIALLADGIVFNIVVGNSEEEMAELFNCQAKEVTPESGQAHIGFGISNGVFDHPPYVPIEPPITEESDIVEEDQI